MSKNRGQSTGRKIKRQRSWKMTSNQSAKMAQGKGSLTHNQDNSFFSLPKMVEDND